jgi:hypothetical protein
LSDTQESGSRNCQGSQLQRAAANRLPNTCGSFV